ncbi:hypothetical protein ACLOJK_029741 [Asimina triloba]
MGNALIDMYAKSGEIDDAVRVFDGYGKHGHGKEAIALFKKMEAKDLKPNDVTFLALLFACSHTGLTDEGWQCFNTMKSSAQGNSHPLIDIAFLIVILHSYIVVPEIEIFYEQDCFAATFLLVLFLLILWTSTIKLSSSTGGVDPDYGKKITVLEGLLNPIEIWLSNNGNMALGNRDHENAAPTAKPDEVHELTPQSKREQWGDFDEFPLHVVWTPSLGTDATALTVISKNLLKKSSHNVRGTSNMPIIKDDYCTLCIVHPLTSVERVLSILIPLLNPWKLQLCQALEQLSIVGYMVEGSSHGGWESVPCCGSAINGHSNGSQAASEPDRPGRLFIPSRVAEELACLDRVAIIFDGFGYRSDLQWFRKGLTAKINVADDAHGRNVLDELAVGDIMICWRIVAFNFEDKVVFRQE